MIITTTSQVEGRHISEYIGMVSGEIISGINIFKDAFAGIRNVVGGRARAYEGELEKAREKALKEMEERAVAMGADAIVGVRLDCEALGVKNDMLMVVATGTAVKLSY